jgi:SAM-dependent methyltransferase
MSRDSKTDLTPIARLYEKSLEEHGTASMGVGWRDEASHQLRFRKLAGVIEGREAVSINDLGCGYGVFLDFLTNSGIEVSLFRGYDISAEMIGRARKLQSKGEFHLGGALDRAADYGFACGIFNVRMSHGESAWLAHIESTLDNLNSFSTRGFAFNLLTSYVDYREPHLFYGDPLYFFDFCKKRYSKKVSLIHDYPLYEWTISVVK